ncbi:hypothetical protein [Clostridium vincentii]|uniref:Uncharacterized protein n=1 Tax=Clostridium vincentii TaxID=52704 RepID=A0A2T0BBL2_9CLOT|nr:hypothetical protein [Clostridium vincentii]PRR81197.1 hypothetical protein CLVI_27010 [Clostridium vincentii]
MIDDVDFINNSKVIKSARVIIPDINVGVILVIRNLEQKSFCP